MSTDVSAQGSSSDYLAAVDEALALAAVAGPRRLPSGVFSRVVVEPAPPRVAAAVWRGVCRALFTLGALASLGVFGVLGAAVLVDWFAPSPDQSACSQVALSVVVVVGVLAVVGLVGVVVRGVAAWHRGDTS